MSFFFVIPLHSAPVSLHILYEFILFCWLMSFAVFYVCDIFHCYLQQWHCVSYYSSDGMLTVYVYIVFSKRLMVKRISGEEGGS